MNDTNITRPGFVVFKLGDGITLIEKVGKGTFLRFSESSFSGTVFNTVEEWGPDFFSESSKDVVQCLSKLITRNPSEEIIARDGTRGRTDIELREWCEIEYSGSDIHVLIPIHILKMALTEELARQPYLLLPRGRLSEQGRGLLDKVERLHKVPAA